MRQLDDFFYNEVDIELSHYTGADALFSIVNSGCLWSSNAYYMNDAQEIVYSCGLLKGVIEKYISEQKVNEDETEFLKQFLDWSEHFKITPYNIFVFSLSEQDSLLSQWRSYTPHGKGVSLTFNPSSINFIAQHNKLRIAKCVYDSSEHKEILIGLIMKLLTSFNKHGKSAKAGKSKAHPSQCYHPFLESYRGDILQVFLVIKNPAFREEQEWRLISSYYPKYTVPEIKFRLGASMLTPYIELTLDSNSSFFERVVLGPSPHPNLSHSALSMFLSNKGVCSHVRNSRIPYREW